MAAAPARARSGKHATRAASSRRAATAAGSMPRRCADRPRQIPTSPSWPHSCAGRRRADRRLSRAARRAARCCSHPAARRRAAHAVPARPVAHARQAPGGGKIDETGAFLDPLIVVRGEDGRLWTPNGRHRLAAAKVLGLKQITALISPRRIARLPHPRAQHREGAQPQGPQPRGDPHGAQPRQAAAAGASGGTVRARSSRRRSC